LNLRSPNSQLSPATREKFSKSTVQGFASLDACKKHKKTTDLAMENGTRIEDVYIYICIFPIEIKVFQPSM